MPTLPTLLPTFQEAEAALAERFADEWVEECLAGDWMQIGISMLHPDATDAMALQIIKGLFVNNVFARSRILGDALGGWVVAQDALRDLILEYKERKEEPPPELETFNRALANRHFKLPKAHGAQRAAHYLSDICAYALVGLLAKQFPSLKVTSRSARRVCHCDIVARVFTKHRDRIGRGTMTREQMQRIWFRLLPLG
jgi:hypothetical protein